MINLGLPGYNSSQCLKLLKEKFNFYNADLIIVLTGFNNHWNLTDSNFNKVRLSKYPTPWGFKMKMFEGILLKSKVYKLCKIFYLNITAKTNPVQFSDKNVISLPKREFPIPSRSDKLQKLLDEGVENYKAGRYDVAETQYRAALALSPEDYEPHWYMGRFYMYKGEEEKSVVEFVLAAKYAPYLYTVTCILSDIKNGTQPQKFACIIKQLRNNLVEKFGEQDVQFSIDPLLAGDENALVELLIYDFTEIANYILQKNSKMVILTYPYSPSRFQYPQDIYYRISNYLNIPLLDYERVFNNYLKKYKKEALFNADGHFTKEGYRLMAENLSDFLRQQNLLPSY